MPAFLCNRCHGPASCCTSLPARKLWSKVPRKSGNSTSNHGNHNAPHGLHATIDPENKGKIKRSMAHNFRGVSEKRAESREDFRGSLRTVTEGQETLVNSTTSLSSREGRLVKQRRKAGAFRKAAPCKGRLENLCHELWRFLSLSPLCDLSVQLPTCPAKPSILSINRPMAAKFHSHVRESWSQLPIGASHLIDLVVSIQEDGEVQNSEQGGLT